MIVRTTDAGEVLESVRILNDIESLDRVIAPAGQDPEVVLEATYGWYWAVDALQTAGANVHLAHPLGFKAFEYGRVMNDFREAADLADLLRMGRLPEVWADLGPGQGDVRARRVQGRDRHAVFFADPQSPWQRGTNVNTNGLLRQYFPKGSDLSRWSAEEIEAVAHALNARPRKARGWKTPAEAFNEHLLLLQRAGVASAG